LSTHEKEKMHKPRSERPAGVTQKERGAMEAPQKMSLLNLYGGGAIERFDVELQRVLNNIQDINTTAGARKVTLVVTVKPLDENRHNVAIGIECKSSICANEAIKSIGLMRLDERGRAYVEEQLPNANQRDLPFGNVTAFAGKGSD
jgi:hypothetical protein